MSLVDDFLGRRLANWEAEEERINPLVGVPVLGLDALASASYGPEAALTILIPAGVMGLHAMPPLIGVIVVILALVYFSYRQTIAAYPSGGGSYTVARENLGTKVGLVAAASLMIDYILNAAVAISAGVGAFISAVPSLQSHIVVICMTVLVLLTLVNLRGIRTTGIALSVPTYLFVLSLLLVIGWGVYKSLTHGGAPPPVQAPPHVPAATAALGVWLLVRAFASGCTAMTGVEAVSNGVPLFAEPAVPNAQRCLTLIVGILGVLLIGIGYLANTYHIAAMDQTKPGYQSVLSQLVAAVAGRNILYYVTIGSVVAVLMLSANTSFAGFPRLCRLLAEDHFLPTAFRDLGRRLVYSVGILLLAIFAGIILFVCGGITDRLIPLFAVGAFTAFTLSQAGMVMHWVRKARERVTSLAVNAVGGAATAAALIIIITAKFMEGAWITVGLCSVLVFTFYAVQRHYRKIAEEIRLEHALDLSDLSKPLVVVPIRGWNKLTQRALRVGYRLSNEIHAVHITRTEKDPEFEEMWNRQVGEPARAAGFEPPRLTVVVSSYRRFFRPVLRHVELLRKKHPDRLVAVILPELIEPHWYEYILHSHRAAALRFFLLLQGDGRTVVINIPWFLGAAMPPERRAKL